MDKDELKIHIQLSLIRDQWKKFALAVLAALVILSLDFFLTISMPKVIEGVSLLIESEDILDAPPYLITLVLLIVIRPIIGWLVSFLQINILLRILRNLENSITSACNGLFHSDKENFSSENSANMLISHGRYYVDNLLIPLMAAGTNLGSIIVIGIGIGIQFPLPLLIFIFTAISSLYLYQILIRNRLRLNGKTLLIAYEDIISFSKDGYSQDMISKDEIIDNKISISDVLDRKMKSSIVIGSISQGLKYAVEFSFMMSFSVATLTLAFLNPESLVIFIAAFAYAGVRMLPSFTSVMAFFQGRSASDHAVRELLNLLHPSKKRF